MLKEVIVKNFDLVNHQRHRWVPPSKIVFINIDHVFAELLVPSNERA